MLALAWQAGAYRLPHSPACRVVCDSGTLQRRARDPAVFTEHREQYMVVLEEQRTAEFLGFRLGDDQDPFRFVGVRIAQQRGLRRIAHAGVDGLPRFPPPVDISLKVDERAARDTVAGPCESGEQPVSGVFTLAFSERVDSLQLGGLSRNRAAETFCARDGKNSLSHPL